MRRDYLTKRDYHLLQTFIFWHYKANCVAHSIGTTFQKAYVDFLKRHRIDCNSDVHMAGRTGLSIEQDEEDYKAVLRQQQLPAKQLAQFCDKQSYLEVSVDNGSNHLFASSLNESTHHCSQQFFLPIL